MSESDMVAMAWELGEFIQKLKRAGIDVDGVVIQASIPESQEAVTHVWGPDEETVAALKHAMTTAMWELGVEIDGGTKAAFEYDENAILEGPWKPTTDKEPA